MAIDSLEVVKSANLTVEEDEVLLLYASPVPPNNNPGKKKAISVDDYPRRSKTFIDLSQDSSTYDDDEEIMILHSFPKTRKRVFIGESSNSKRSELGKISTIPLSFLCEICADEKLGVEKFRILGCSHSYCSECMSKYVGSKIQVNISKINCPVSGCNGFLEPEHCRSILPRQVFERWGDAFCEAMVLASERFYCPFKDCSALLINETNGGNKDMLESECPNCKRLFCVQCKVPWHAGIDCAQFQALNKDERSNEDIQLMNLGQRQSWKSCPYCRFFVQKVSGCDTIYCRCGRTFSYNSRYY